jgi:RNA polymerase sigma-B factor
MRAKTKTKAKYDEGLFNKYYPLVKIISKKYCSWKEPLADLEQVGAMGLMKAMKRYSKKLGKEFASFASPTIDGEIRHYLRDKIGSVKISRKWIELNTKINRVVDEQRAATGKKVSNRDVARLLRVKAAKVEKAKDAVNIHFTSSLDQPLYPMQGAEGSVVTLGEVMGAEDHADDVIQQSTIKDALKTLPERSREIISRIFFEDELQSDVARKTRITQAQVSRIIRQSLSQLKGVLA